MVNFLPNFGPAIVTPIPGVLQGSGPAALGGRKLCVLGDEKNVSVPGCTYMTPVFSIPGTGMLKILTLGPDQIAKQTMAGGKPVLLKGSMFTAEFSVMVPAQQPPVPPKPPIPDPVPKYVGQGMFITTNVQLQGT